jgi:hypothetical protein
MITDIEVKNGHRIAIIQNDEILITDTQSALDLIATMNYEHEAMSSMINY